MNLYNVAFLLCIARALCVVTGRRVADYSTLNGVAAQFPNGTQVTNGAQSTNGTTNRPQSTSGTQPTNRPQSTTRAQSTSGTHRNLSSLSTNGTEASNTIPSIPDPGDCDFELSTCLWGNEDGDDFDWTRHTGRTGSSGTGPPTDHSGNGYYMYIETSYPRRRGEQARLVGGPFSGTKCMRFFHYMYGAAVADLQVFLRQNNSGMDNFLWGKYTNQGQGWYSENISVYGENYKIMFVGRVGRNYEGDIAIDDITFENGLCSGDNTTDPPTSYLELVGEPGTCNFDSGYCDWINSPIGDQFDWERKQGPTGTPNTGPNQDHSGRNGFYVFAESSAPQKEGHTALLTSPRLCGQLCLQFFYHMVGVQVGSLNLYKREGIKNDDKLWTRTGNQAGNWTEALVDIGGACYRLVLQAVIGRSYVGDIAVDDILIRKGSCCALRMRFFDSGEVGNCTFDEDLCSWWNSADDDFDWIPNGNGTQSVGTGPFAGYDGKGQYIYIESSEPRNIGDKAMLVSGDLQGLQCMRFKYHMFGETVGSLAFYLYGNGLVRTLLWRKFGNQGNQWHAGQITLPCQPATYHVEVVAQIGGWSSDVALDNVEFTSGNCPPVTHTPRPVSTTRSPTSPLNTHFEGNCTFPGHFCYWTNDNADKFDWMIHSGKTVSRQTGPTSDADGNGLYIYMESSLLVEGQTARLISGYMTGTQCLSFRFHMLGEGVGSLTVDQKEIGNRHWHTKWRRGKNQGNFWHEASVTVSGQRYQVAILGTRGTTFQSDIAVDTITLGPGRCSDGEDSSLISVCSFNSGFCDWKNEVSADKFDWILTSGHTPSLHTGPDTGHGGYGQYAFIETSSPRRPGDNATLKMHRSGGERCLYFYYHMYGDTIGALKVYQQRTGMDDTPTLLWTKRGSHRNRWRRARVSIKEASSYWILIEGVRGHSYSGDIGIDDIGFSKGSCYAKARG